MKGFIRRRHAAWELARLAVIGQLARDGAVELVQIDIDKGSSW